MKTIELDPDIIIIPEKRQRQDLGNVAELAASMKARSQIHPIVVDNTKDGYVLVAGGRRLAAAKLNKSTIWATCKSDLPPMELKLIELDENAKRKDITWQERAAAIKEIHGIYCTMHEEWTQEKTAESLGFSVGWIADSLKIAEHLDDPNISKAITARTAVNQVGRIQSRRIADITSELFSDGKAEPIKEVVVQASFLDWAPSYEGQPFNFIHCDFPYGVGLQDSDQMGEDWNKEEMYDDDPEVYTRLLSCLGDNLGRIAYPSCHILFWFPITRYQETIDILSSFNLTVNKVPIVWVKTDNRGILPDPKRGPRQIYETAFICSRGDRLIVRSTSNAYPAPSAQNKLHPSEKPEPVLRYFFQMFVDERSRVFDPTAGSGSALRAADSMKAEAIFGLELKEEYVTASNNSIEQARRLRSLSEKVT